MKKNFFSVITAFILLCSCTKDENNISEFNGTGKWWYIKCIDINTNSGSHSIQGKLDYGNFYFYSNGKYSRKFNPFALESCRYPNSYVIYPNGAGLPPGDISSGANDSTWNINGNTLNISKYGSWKIINIDDSILVIKSSRTDYNYNYTLIAE